MPTTFTPLTASASAPQVRLHLASRRRGTSTTGSPASLVPTTFTASAGPSIIGVPASCELSSPATRPCVAVGYLNSSRYPSRAMAPPSTVEHPCTGGGCATQSCKRSPFPHGRLAEAALRRSRSHLLLRTGTPRYARSSLPRCTRRGQPASARCPDIAVPRGLKHKMSDSCSSLCRLRWQTILSHNGDFHFMYVI